MCIKNLNFENISLNKFGFIFEVLKGFGFGFYSQLLFFKCCGFFLGFTKKRSVYEDEDIGQVERARFIKFLDFFFLDSNLKYDIRNNRLRLLKIRSYRGFRYFLKLPCRGQRTKTNAGTCKSGVNSIKLEI